MLAIVQKGRGTITKWRKENPTVVADLCEADLTEADLRGVNLKRSDLVGANLTRAQMSRVDLTRADLTRCDLTGTSLQAAELNGAIFTGAAFCDANLLKARMIRATLDHSSIRDTVMSSVALNDADLSDATLDNVNLSNADLRGANLTDAVLTDIDFSETNLTDCRLDGAQLRGVDFTGANLTGCRLSGVGMTDCRFGWTILGDLDLSGVTGLDTCRHDAPSTIGVDTIYRSSRSLPDAFLRQAGVQKETLEALAGVESEFIRAPVCLISHLESEEEFAQTLQTVLRGKGVRCWRDVKPNNAEDYATPMSLSKPEQWDALLICSTRNYLEGPWVEEEFRVAETKEKQGSKSRGKANPVYHVLLLDSYLNSGSWDHPLRPEIAKRVVGEFHSWRRSKERFLQQADEIIERISAGLKKK